jgi:ketosteroid isomerase-like protein
VSEENVDLLRRITEAFDRGDLEHALALADPPPEFEFVPSGVLIPDLASVQRGPDGLRRLAEWLWAEFDDFHVEVHEFIDAGDQVFVSATLRGRGKHRRGDELGCLGRMDRAGGPRRSLAGIHGP